MNAGLTTHDLPDEYFVLQIDGRVRSGHRRFADALRAALLLRDQFPQHDVKVRAMQPTPNLKDAHWRNVGSQAKLSRTSPTPTACAVAVM